MLGPPHKPRGSLEPSHRADREGGRGRHVVRGLGTLALEGKGGEGLLGTRKEDGGSLRTELG